MSSSRFATIIARVPEERGAIRRLERKLHRRRFAEGTEYTLGRLFDVLRASSLEGLALVMAEMVREGLFRVSIRVKSSEGEVGIREFERIEDVPDRIYDENRDVEVDVTPDMLALVYRPRGVLQS